MELSTYLITTAVTPNKIIALVVLLALVAGGYFYWQRSR